MKPARLDHGSLGFHDARRAGKAHQFVLNGILLEDSKNAEAEQARATAWIARITYRTTYRLTHWLLIHRLLIDWLMIGWLVIGWHRAVMRITACTTCTGYGR
jgi:hypothetical protein